MEEMRLKLLWSNLFGLRFMLTIMPQNTYLSHDEFSESPSKMAGAILDLDTATLPHEERPPDASENILFPLLSSGIPYLLLRAIRDGVFGGAVTPYLVLVFPRIWSTFVSLLTDIYIYKTSVNCGCSSKEASVAMVLFASSHLTWVFFTRTFSTGIEASLLAMMLYIITKDIIPENGNTEVGFTKRASLVTDGFKLAASLVIGISCNPFFMAFSVFPITYWVLKPLRNAPADVAVYRIVTGGISFLASVFINCLLVKLCNQLYYDPSMLSNLVQEFNVNKLATWVTQPYASFSSVEFDTLENIPIKFTAVTLLVLMGCGPLAASCFRNVMNIRSLGTYGFSVLILSVMATMFVAILVRISSPIVMIPIIVPLTILCAKRNMSNWMVISWCVYNVAAFFVTGIELQAGVIPSVEFLHSVATVHTHVAESAKDLTLTAVYYKTPAPSRHLAAWTNPKLSDLTDPGHLGLQRLANLHFLDANNRDIERILDRLLLLEPGITLFLVMPAAVPCSLIFRLHMLYELELFRQFFPHVLLGEEMPNFSNREEWCTSYGDWHEHITSLFLDKLSLNLYKVERTHKRAEEEAAISETTNEQEGVKLVLNNYSSAM